MKLDIIQQQQIGAPQTSTEEWLTAINRLVGTPPEPSEQSH